MFSFITMNWQGRPHTDLRTIIELTCSATTQTGLQIQAAHNPTWHPKDIKITDTELAAIPLTRHHRHEDWNHTITAQPTLT